MADYVPLPFVPQPIDQTSQRMKLADLLYQANLARMQADQQRQMGIAQMVAQLGQQIGGGLEGWLSMQQKERQFALQQARENRLIAAQNELAKRQAESLKFQQEQGRENLQRQLFEEAPEGREFPVESALDLFGRYASNMEYSPEVTATKQMISPAETMAIGPTAMHSQPDVLPSTAMPLSVLAGVASPETTRYMATLAKPVSPETQKRLDDIERANELDQARADLNTAVKSGDAAQINASAKRLSIIDPTFGKDQFEQITGISQTRKSPEQQFIDEMVPQVMEKEKLSRAQATLKVQRMWNIETRPPSQPSIVVSPITGDISLIDKGSGVMRPVAGAGAEGPSGAAAGTGSAAPTPRSPLTQSLMGRWVNQEAVNKRPGLRNMFSGMNDAQIVQSVINDSPLVSEKNKDSVQKRMASLNTMNSLKSEINRLGTGIKESTIANILLYLGQANTSDPQYKEKQELRAKINRLAEQVKIELTGLASTQTEQKRYENIVPLTSITTDMNVARLNSLIDEVKNQQKSALSMIDERLPNDPAASMYFGGGSQQRRMLNATPGAEKFGAK